MKHLVACLLFLLIAVACRKDKKVAETGSTGTPSDFLKGSNYTKLVVQVIYVTGMKPEDGTLNNLSSFLSARLNKPGGIEMVFREISPTGKPSLTLDDVKALEKQWRSVNTGGQTLTAAILYLDGDYVQNSGSSKVLGIAYGFSSMAVFEKTVRDLSGGITQPSRVLVESSVTNHEFGHVLGLVDNGTAMTTTHLDGAHGHHCSNKSCLMYYATETSDIISNLVGGNVPQPERNCISDLQAAGGK
jgi:hypothetical protein